MLTIIISSLRAEIGKVNDRTRARYVYMKKIIIIQQTRGDYKSERKSRADRKREREIDRLYIAMTRAARTLSFRTRVRDHCSPRDISICRMCTWKLLDARLLTKANTYRRREERERYMILSCFSTRSFAARSFCVWQRYILKSSSMRVCMHVYYIHGNVI